MNAASLARIDRATRRTAPRRALEALIEHMIEYLDFLDGDADMEPETVEAESDFEAEAGV